MSFSETDREVDGYKRDNIRCETSFLWETRATDGIETEVWLFCNNCVSLCRQSVQHSEVISLNAIVLPVIKSNLIPIVPHKGSVELLPATVFVLKVKGDVLAKYH